MTPDPGVPPVSSAADDTAGAGPPAAARQPASGATPTVSRPPASAPTPTGPRSWLRRIRRSAQATPTEADYPVVDPVEGRRASLLNRHPFTTGFLLTLGALTAYALLTSLVQIRWVIFLVILALFLALGLNPAVEWLHRRGLRRGLSVALVAVVVLALLALAGWAIIPIAGQQITVLVQNAPSFLNELRQNPQIAELDQRYNIINRVNEYLTSNNLINSLFGGLLGAGQAVVNGMVSTIITVVLTLYFLASMPSLKDFIYQLAPASRRPRVRYLANEIFGRIGGYLTGLFVIVTCTTTCAFLFMMVIGLGQYALALGVIVALCAFIPLVGLTISMTIVSIVAFAVSPTTGLITLIYFLLYMQLDSYLIQPRVYQRSVALPGVVAILAAVSGGALYGLMGAILAVPTAAALTVLYQEVLVPALNKA